MFQHLCGKYVFNCLYRLRTKDVGRYQIKQQISSMALEAVQSNSHKI